MVCDSRQEAISIHAPRGGSDENSCAFADLFSLFQSTLPAGGATKGDRFCEKKNRYFNPRSPRGERRSIAQPVVTNPYDFNPRSPRGERPWCSGMKTRRRKFQSTLPAGGATTLAVMSTSPRKNFNPRSPRGERRYNYDPTGHIQFISIHAPRGGSDCFQTAMISLVTWISIHAPRGGSDKKYGDLSRGTGKFQSTLPAGGATDRMPELIPVAKISIHAPRGGSDFSAAPVLTTTMISIHAPRGGSDAEYCRHKRSGQRHFNPRSPRGERQQKCMFFMREFIHIP